MTQIEINRNRDFGKKLNATIEFIKQNFKPLFKSLLYIAGPFIIVGSLLFTQVFSGFFKVMINQSQGVDPSFDNVMGMGAYALVGALFFLIGSTAIIAIVNDYIIIYEKKGNTDISVHEIWESVKQSFFTVLGTMILYVLLMVAAYILILTPTALIGAISSAIMVIAMIAFYCAMIYVMITFSLIFIIRAYEKVGFGTAVKRCFYLIKDKWWSTFGLLLVASIIKSVVSSIFFIPWYANLLYTMLHNVNGQPLEDPSLTFEIINNLMLLLYFVSSYILYCIPLIAIAFQYFNLVELKESRGLMSKIDTFGSDQSKEDDEEHY